MALIHANFFSEALGMCTACDVILPQPSAEFSRAEPRLFAEGFPTLWLLHGMSDDHTIWQRRTSIERYAAALGLAVVMPDAGLSSYCNMAHGQAYYTYIASELPDIMRSVLPLSSKHSDNFIAGLSMCGEGCFKIGLANPERYAAIGCFSAGAINRRTPVSPETAARMMLTYGVSDYDMLRGTVNDALCSARRILEKGLPCPRIFHSIGRSDFLINAAHSTRDFFEALEGNPFDYVYEEHDGAHNWEYWDEHIKDFLAYLGLKPLKGICN